MACQYCKRGEIRGVTKFAWVPPVENVSLEPCRSSPKDENTNPKVISSFSLAILNSNIDKNHSMFKNNLPLIGYIRRYLIGIGETA